MVNSFGNLTSLKYASFFCLYIQYTMAIATAMTSTGTMVYSSRVVTAWSEAGWTINLGAAKRNTVEIIQHFWAILTPEFNQVHADAHKLVTRKELDRL
jgi:hypothetical protein